MRIPALLLLTVLAFGCAHRAQHYSAPNSGPMVASSQKLAAAVVSAKKAIAAASAAVNEAKQAHAAEVAKLGDLEPKIDYIFSIAPQELKPKVAEVQLEVGELKEAQMLTTAKINAAEAAQAIATGKLEEANAAKNEVEKLTGAYLGEVQKLTDRANTAETEWAKDAKSLQWYRLHWFMGIFVTVGGLALCAFVAFLKFTGRLIPAAATALRPI